MQPSWIVVGLSLLSITAAAAAGGCTEDEDCSLNGVCSTNGMCACDKPWTGPECGKLDFLPAPIKPVYGGASNTSLNYSTWGGNPAYKNGAYHLFVARIPGTLAMWYKTSQIDYAVSKTITGPYEFQSVVLPAFAHNPQIVHQTFKNGTEKFVLFHIGHGGIHASDTPEGPFVAVAPADWDCDNPAPYWDAGEELWYVTCRTKKHGMRTAKNLEGPWTQIGAQPPEPPAGPDTWCEDPYLYRDARGNWHALFHAVDLKELSDCGNSASSSHSFSRDLKTWKTLSTYVQPYTSVVALEDGSNKTLASVERPKFFFNAQGQPTHLFNGAANVPECGGQTGGKNPRPNSCSDCKYLDHTNTIVRPLNV